MIVINISVDAAKSCPSSVAFNYQYYSWNEELDLNFDASNENRLVKVCIIKIWGDHLILNYESKLSRGRRNSQFIVSRKDWWIGLAHIYSCVHGHKDGETTNCINPNGSVDMHSMHICKTFLYKLPVCYEWGSKQRVSHVSDITTM